MKKSERAEAQNFASPRSRLRADCVTPKSNNKEVLLCQLSRGCHPERGEGSFPCHSGRREKSEILRSAQNDMRFARNDIRTAQNNMRTAQNDTGKLS